MSLAAKTKHSLSSDPDHEPMIGPRPPSDSTERN